MVCKVESVVRFESVEQMLEAVAVEKLVPGLGRAEAMQLYEEMYPRGPESGQLWCIELSEPKEFAAVEVVDE